MEDLRGQEYGRDYWASEWGDLPQWLKDEEMYLEFLSDDPKNLLEKLRVIDLLCTYGSDLGWTTHHSYAFPYWKTRL